MVYKIKEKFWSWGDDFSITDQQGNPCYRVKGKVFSWGDQLSFQDAQGKELAYISQKLLSFMPRYEIHRNGKLFAELKKEFTWIKQKFTLDVPGPNDYTIEGSFWQHEFSFLRQGRVVARIQKKFFNWTNSYGVDITEGEDEVSILCACIVIDEILEDQKDS